MSEYLDRKKFWSIEEAVDELREQCAGYSVKVLLQGYGHNKAIIAQMLDAGIKVSVGAYPNLERKRGIWDYDVTVIK